MAEAEMTPLEQELRVRLDALSRTTSHALEPGSPLGYMIASAIAILTGIIDLQLEERKSDDYAAGA